MNCFEGIPNILIPSKEKSRNGRSVEWKTIIMVKYLCTLFSYYTVHDYDDNCNTYVKKDPCIHIPTTIMYNLQKIAAASNTWQLPSLRPNYIVVRIMKLCESEPAGGCWW